ncbi:pyridoxal phosphate synthase yaaD subunit [Methanocella conradii HZ254]|uniref:Pyridoxal 5'-phosphate synthase subunit PdxS n=1 Tax=Methanocella conradii (strain DSM 24694 / JCM 17849 / CGMCC 1.5162 / HZ254) TaxID=1041930 RepID=H8IAL8_METCZ|nr:pyridoxal 5'-phosphate synthase lyase subunit PdxS [Methanocella conradii]AFD00115.1 pyridoxal phosphate synthase yaaD subunit [Methanocella conradii HZ254]MDI6896066.1 pyridoxal 5'-phosphate synthase lyase subunit PdxS [Methanocella conradii]
MKLEELRHGTTLLKRGFAKMQKGGVIMDVTNREQALIAESAGAVAVMALQAVPADIRKAGGVARMADPAIIEDIIDAVTIPVMAKVRIGHFVEAEILEAIGVDMIDESEVLTPADSKYHIDKTRFTVPFVCGARDLGEALRRIDEGAAMIRTKGEAGTGDVSEAVNHMKKIQGQIRELKGLTHEELIKYARAIEAPSELVIETARLQRLPVVNFAAGGIATPADAALMMRLGADGVFVGSGIFKSENPEKMARAIVEAVNNYDNPPKLAEISKGIGSPMKGIGVSGMPAEEKIQVRGW